MADFHCIMPMSDDNAQVLTSAVSGDCTSIPAENPMNSPFVKNPDEKFSSNMIDLEDRDAIETPGDMLIDGTACLIETESDVKEEQQDPEQAMTTQQREIATAKDHEETAEGDMKSLKTESMEENMQDGVSGHTESKSGTEQTTEDDIEWLSPFSMPRVKEGEDDDTNTVEKDDSADINGKDNALKMLKKGAVAAVGGTMVGMGLVMIPLPTPFGAVVASSGLAVLGTEFDEAKDLNDRLIDGAKGHLNKARDAMVKGIENMNQDANDEDHFDSSHTKILNENDSSVENETNETGQVIKVNAAAALRRESNAHSNIDEDSEHSEHSETGSTSESPPVWLHMNPIERERQVKLAKQKYRRDRQTSYEQAKEAFTKRTGKFLSKNILPFIKKTDPSDDREQVTDIDTSMTAKIDESDKIISTTEKGENSEIIGNETKTKPLTEEKKYNECHTFETNENDSDGYVVVS